MKNKKIKLSLIDDYIKIILIKNFLNNSFSAFELDQECVKELNYSKQLLATLENTYNQLFVKLKLKDLSFDILTKELEQNNSLFLNTTSLNLNKTITNNSLTLNTILNNLKFKLEHLKLNISCKNFTNY
ncbi:MAG: hypothetical protein IKY10_03925 [Clostridia bacterium]|nr:hypothetical protein [Clostridia bacterium]